MNGRAKQAEIYPDELCKEIVKGLVDQIKVDEGEYVTWRIDGVDIGAVVINDREYYEEIYDDLSGERLDPDGVMQARKEEMSEVRKHGVYVKVPISRCWEETGKAPIGVRWVDVNKGDQVHPEYRSRLVAKEIKHEKREDLFAATPPLEAKKMLLSMACLLYTSPSPRD